jgi:hypothetical protein
VADKDAGGVVEIEWVANLFRGDDFEAVWTPSAEAVLRYGATGWAFLRSKEDIQHFKQLAVFESKLDFDRYWASEEIVEARANAAGLFQLPVAPIWHVVVGSGMLAALTN